MMMILLGIEWDLLYHLLDIIWLICLEPFAIMMGINLIQPANYHVDLVPF